MSRDRQKACSHCQQLASVLYRVQFEASGSWAFVCPNCWPSVRHNNPFYTYGGTWKAKKK